MSIEKQIVFKGKLMTLGEFADNYLGGDIENAQATFDTLVSQGKGYYLEAQKSQEQITIEKAHAKQALNKVVKHNNNEVEQSKDYHAQVKREGRPLYEQIEIDYPTYQQALEAQSHFIEKLRLSGDNIEIVAKVGRVILRVQNITDDEFRYINRIYKTNNAVGAIVGLADSGVKGITSAVDYSAKKVVTPVLTIGTKATISIAKTLISTLTRTGATVITAGAEGARRTACDVAGDAEVLKAVKELSDTKDALNRTIAKRTGVASSGIRITR